MAINSPKPGAPNPTPTPMAPKQDNSKQRIIAIAAIIGVALLAINIALLIGYNNRGKATANLTSELNESEQLKAELEQQYYEALSELEEMRGDNEQLNAMIDQQKEELKQQKTRIDDLIRTERSYNKIRKEMASLKSQADQYIAEINQLREENAELTTQNTQLAESNQELNSNLTIAQEANDQLNTEKALLVSEKEELSTEKANLSRKVNIASVIKVESFDIQPMMVRKSGKAVKRNNADKIDYLSICFNTAVNEIAEPGNEQFVIRVNVALNRQNNGHTLP